MSSARRGGVDDVILNSGGTSKPIVRAGTVDPSAGGGIAAPEGSLFLRFVATAGELWLKTGAANTAWTQIALDTGDVSTIPEKWTLQEVEPSLTDQDLNALVSTSFDTIKAIRAGSIRGLSTRFTGSITDATANSAVVTVTVNGVAGTLSIGHSSGSNPSGGEAVQAAGIDTFSAGDLLGIQITTLASYTPDEDLDLESWMDVSFS